MRFFLLKSRKKGNNKGREKSKSAFTKKKNYMAPRSKTFRSRSPSRLLTNAVECSLKRPAELNQPPSKNIQRIDCSISQNNLILQIKFSIGKQINFIEAGRV
tara:strand:- start:72 stop:377 length:306 start_codon:yes stop_codon:yes gene_type:complete